MTVHKKFFAQLIKNWPAKVISVVIAVFLFAFHRLGDLEERFITVPLMLELSDNLVPCSSYPQNVYVTLRGPNTIFHVRESDIEAFADLSGYLMPGIYKAGINIRRKGSAMETEIPEITAEPREISVELDTRISKVVSVSPDFKGHPEQGFEMASFTLIPKEAAAEGPEKLLKTLSELNTELIDLQGRNADFSVKTGIKSPSQFIKIRGEPFVLFKGFVRELLIIRSLNDLPVGIRGLSENLYAVLDPPVASVKVHGVQSILENSSMAIVSLYIDCLSISEPGLYELPLLTDGEKDIRIERLEPEIIKAEIRKK